MTISCTKNIQVSWIYSFIDSYEEQAESLEMLGQIEYDFEDEKDQEEQEKFFRLLAHTPYRKLMIIEGKTAHLRVNNLG